MIDEQLATVSLKTMTVLFANLKFRQQLLLKQLPLDTPWDDLKYNPAHSDVVTSLLKLLRMAALMKYITQYTRLSKSRPFLLEHKIFEKIMQSNLMSDDKELEYLLIFLEVNISEKLLNDFLTAVRPNIAAMKTTMTQDISIFTKTKFSVADVRS
jgi:hypothetical protein